MSAGNRKDSEIMGRIHGLVLATLLIVACLCAVVIGREVVPPVGCKDSYVVKESPKFYFLYFCESCQAEIKTLIDELKKDSPL